MKHASLYKAQGRELSKRSTEPPQTKSCLKCTKDFPSEHKFNRLCKKCIKVCEETYEPPQELTINRTTTFIEVVASEMPFKY